MPLRNMAPCFTPSSCHLNVDHGGPWRPTYAGGQRPGVMWRRGTCARAAGPNVRSRDSRGDFRAFVSPLGVSQ